MYFLLVHFMMDVGWYLSNRLIVFHIEYLSKMFLKEGGRRGLDSEAFSYAQVIMCRNLSSSSWSQYIIYECRKKEKLVRLS